jgi:two-component system chemotaxis response regulator CheY
MEVSLSRAMRVLIADDEKDVGKALAEMVSSCNHEIAGVVSSGLEAIHAYTRFRPDLVLMDYRMSKLNGATACRNILSKDPAARVILVSAWSPSEDATASGAIAFLPKPLDLERLNAALQAVAQKLPLAAPSRAEVPNSEIRYQPDSIDYSPPVAQPLPVVPPSLEMSFPVDAKTSHPPQAGEARGLDEDKISATRRSIRRRFQRARVHQTTDR